MDMRFRLAITPTLAVICVTATLLYTLDYYVTNQIRGHILEDLTHSANTAANAILIHGVNDDINDMDALADELGRSSNRRISIIRYDGMVVGDSALSVTQLGKMDNHLHRPEVQAALNTGFGIAQRSGTSLGKEMLYVTVRQGIAVDFSEKQHAGSSHEDEAKRLFYVVRAAIDTEAVGKQLYPIQLAFIVVAILGIFTILGFGLLQSRYLSRKLSRATEELEHEVENRTQDIAMLQRLGSSLGACSSMQEAGDVIRLIVERILPGTSGGVYITKSSRNVEELLVSWGDTWEGVEQFAPDQCWAMRKGRSHRSNEDDLRMLCQHLESHSFSQSLCIPLVAQGESLGTFTILTDAPDWRTEDIKMAQTLAEQMSIILASLQLRLDLRQQAIRDPLTGLFNRRYMMETLFQVIGRAARNKSTACVLMIDIDDFKLFNDTYGHDLGDTVLKQVASEMKQCIRIEDTLCRYGGEEFCLVCPDLGERSVKELGVRLCEHVHRLTLDVQDTRVSSITISVGMAIYPEHGREGEDLLREADEALYQAKAHGKNQAVLAVNKFRDDGEQLTSVRDKK
jgi:diguanylate cyclase (GGDEF)-like protein